MGFVKKSVLTLLILAVIAVTVWFIFENWHSNKIQLLPAPEYIKTNLAADELPDVFPKDLIQEKDVKILENYSADVEKTEKEAAKVQYTIKFLSSKNAIENQKLYSNFIKSAGWNFLSQTNDVNSFHIRAVKDAEQIYIDFIDPLMEITLIQIQI